MVWPSWLRARAHAYAPIALREETSNAVENWTSPTRVSKNTTAKPPLLLHHLLKPTKRNDTTRRRVLIGTVCITVFLALFVMTLARIKAAQSAAGHGEGNPSFFGGLRASIAALANATYATITLCITTLVKATGDASKALLDVLSFKLMWGKTQGSSPDTNSVTGTRFYSLAKQFRRSVVIPTLQAFVAVAAFLSALVAADRMFHFYVAVYWKKVVKKDPARLRWKTIALPTAENTTSQNISEFPKVVIQLPMFNEKEVCGDVIDAACLLDWPRSRLLIQVLDDSTCAETRQRVDDKVFEWREKGVEIYARRRTSREGYKAGAMLEAENDLRGKDGRFGGGTYTPSSMKQDLKTVNVDPGVETVDPEVLSSTTADPNLEKSHSRKHDVTRVAAISQGYEYVIIFDADFDPHRGFIRDVIPTLNANKQVGFVQARWTYVNSDESLLTKVQEISLNYHIKCEQFARHAAGVFFNFNGTAGAWRLTCIEDAGGWTPRTTVEDMDLSLRAYLKGWKFVFLNDITCDCEIPACYDAYRKQQHRWSCGPAQLFKIAVTQTWAAKNIPITKRIYLVFLFFGTRMFASHVVSFALYCALIPICAAFPEVVIPFWALVYTPVLVTISTVAFTHNGWRNAIPYVLCENAMSIVKVTAMLSGLLGWANAHEWVVTTKLGRFINKEIESVKSGKAGKVAEKVVTKIKKARGTRKTYGKECVMGCFFIACALYGASVHAMWQYGLFLTAQGVVFLAFGLNYVDGK